MYRESQIFGGQMGNSPNLETGLFYSVITLLLALSIGYILTFNSEQQL